jgi:predicted acetyltransferase
MVELVAPDVSFESSYRDACNEFAAEGLGEHLALPARKQTFRSFVRELHEHSQGRHLPAGWVSGSTFWLVDTAGAFIGQVEIRHRLTDALRLRGGHVGYAIRPSMQRRGHGTRALALALPECVKFGLDRVLVTCDATNDASRRIIEANGGVLEDVVELDGRPVPTMRFWIELGAYDQ